jgi:hypothetical protein
VNRDELQQFADALHWINAAQVQLERFATAFEESQTALRQPLGPGAWRRGMYSADAHLLLVAMRHVNTALDRIDDRFEVPALSDGLKTSTRLLRNILEHWDEQRDSFSTAGASKVQSGKRFADRFPDSTPWSFSFSGDAEIGLRIGGAFSVVDAQRELEAIVGTLEPLWLQALTDVGLLPYRGPACEFRPTGRIAASAGQTAVDAFNGQATVAVEIVEGDKAAILVIADPHPDSDIDGCPWWATAVCTPKGWMCTGGGNGTGGWHSHEDGRGIAYKGGAAAAGAQSVTLRFRGKEFEVPVLDGYYAWACFDARADEWIERFL